MLPVTPGRTTMVSGSMGMVEPLALTVALVMSPLPVTVGGGVQIQIPDGAVDADVQGGAGGPLVHRHLIGHAAADAQEGGGGAVDDLLDVAGQLELSASAPSSLMRARPLPSVVRSSI